MYRYIWPWWRSAKTYPCYRVHTTNVPQQPSRPWLKQDLISNRRQATGLAELTFLRWNKILTWGSSMVKVTQSYPITLSEECLTIFSLIPNTGTAPRQG